MSSEQADIENGKNSDVVVKGRYWERENTPMSSGSADIGNGKPLVSSEMAIIDHGKDWDFIGIGRYEARK